MMKIIIIIFLICIVASCGIWKNEILNINSENQTVDKNTGVFLTNGLTNVEEKLQRAVSLAIKNKGRGYYNGEYITEGHIILDIEEKEGKTKVYTLASIGWFGFENSIFTKTSGSGAIPTVITFFKNEHGEYSLLEYKEPTEGFGGTESKKEMFPMKLWDSVLNANQNYENLKKQQEIQAENYLKTIGRTAKVSADHLEKKLGNINVGASNKLVAEFTRQDVFLNHCPYWLGTREQIENGTRYIYEKSQSKSSDGYDIITFRKIKEDGGLIEEKKYKIVGSEPQFIN